MYLMPCGLGRGQDVSILSEGVFREEVREIESTEKFELWRC